MAEPRDRTRAAVERAARHEAAAGDADLRPGESVAWSVCARMEQTDGFSAVHRVGSPSGGTALTLCGEIIPPAVRHVPLTPRLAHSLGRCRYCEAMAINQENAA